MDLPLFRYIQSEFLVGAISTIYIEDFLSTRRFFHFILETFISLKFPLLLELYIFLLTRTEKDLCSIFGTGEHKCHWFFKGTD